MNRRRPQRMWTKRRDVTRVTYELRVREHIGKRSNVRNLTVDVQGVEKAHRVVFVEMELACCEGTSSLGDSFVPEFNQRTRRGVACRCGNDEIRVGPGTQLGTPIVRSRQHHALEQHGPDTRIGM